MQWERLASTDFAHTNRKPNTILMYSIWDGKWVSERARARRFILCMAQHLKWEINVSYILFTIYCVSIIWHTKRQAKRVCVCIMHFCRYNEPNRIEIICLCSMSIQFAATQLDFCRSFGKKRRKKITFFDSFKLMWIASVVDGKKITYLKARCLPPTPVQ